MSLAILYPTLKPASLNEREVILKELISETTAYAVEGKQIIVLTKSGKTFIQKEKGLQFTFNYVIKGSQNRIEFTEHYKNLLNLFVFLLNNIHLKVKITEIMVHS